MSSAYLVDRGAAIRAWLRLDMRERQLSVLRNTYPGWDIRLEQDGFGHPWWTALLRQRVTVHMVTGGVMQGLRRRDAIALASALAWQTALLYIVRVPGPP